MLQGLKKGETWIDLGDDILVRVTAAVVYGGKKLDLLSLPPVGGYTEKLVSVSVGQVCGIRFQLLPGLIGAYPYTDHSGYPRAGARRSEEQRWKPRASEKSCRMGEGNGNPP